MSDALCSAVFTWHFEGDDILQQSCILGFFGQAVWPQGELILLHSRDPKCSCQTVSTVAHCFCRRELCHSGKLHTRNTKGYNRGCYTVHWRYNWMLREASLLIWIKTTHHSKTATLIDVMWINTSGDRCARRMLPIKLSLWPNVFALLRDSMVFLILRLWRIGTSDMNSTPPATILSHWPAAIMPTAREKEGGRKRWTKEGPTGREAARKKRDWLLSVFSACP